MRNSAAIAWMLLALGSPWRLEAQTTQGLIAGKVFDGDTKLPLARVTIEYIRRELGKIVETGSSRTNEQGFYAFAFLPPGTYQLRVRVAAAGSSLESAPSAGDYQPQEIHELELFVASRLEVNFALRKLTDVWKAGIREGLYQNSTTAILHFYAADVAQLRSGYLQIAPYRSSSLESTVSDVIDPKSLENLPLAGRDVYATLAVAPGVTSDAGTARGLGLSSNGQRPAASNFLLDGLENNNMLVTGPLTSLAPEMVQEYRISTSSWSAEYGRTQGYLANAITRAGGASWHGTAYFDLKNDALDANTFQNNAYSDPRPPFKETQYGFQSGGPVWRQSLFFSAGLDIYRSRGYQPAISVTVPSPAIVLRDVSPTARELLTRFPTPATIRGNGVIASIPVRPTVSVDRRLGLARADYVAGARRLMARVAVNRFDWPDFIWYPYKAFISGLSQPVDSVALGYTEAIRPTLAHEFRAGWSRNSTGWDRAHPEIPAIAISSTLAIARAGQAVSVRDATLVPGSPALYGFRHNTRNFELNDNWLSVRSSHIVKAGGGFLYRNVEDAASIGQDGRAEFSDIFDFLNDAPASYTAAVDRQWLPELRQPQIDRAYRNTQFFLFAEDTWRVAPRLVLNFGLRYENFGVPINIGVNKDAQVQLGAGTGFPQKISTASVVYSPAGDQKLFAADNRNFAPRFGFALYGGGGLLIRGGYGIFFDRPFDNLLENVHNSVVIPPSFPCVTRSSARNLCADYLATASQLLPRFQGLPLVADFPSPTLIDPGLRDGYTQSYFLGVQKRISDSWEAEINTLGALGRKLVTSDVVNRGLSTPRGRYNPALGDIVWRSNQGLSDYNALTASARYRARSGLLRLSYSWSHSIDNQSDPLAGEFFNFSFVNFTSRGQSQTRAAFTRQFDSRADRANSDFDQRHNFVFFSWWELPSARGRGLAALTRHWRVAQMAAFRSGFPYSVTAPSTGALLNQRANLVLPDQTAAPAGAPAERGAVALLNRAAFEAPRAGVPGSSGRNAFRGPGLWNVDLSVSRSFPLHPLGEAGRLNLRADFFNAFNHANLNNPDSFFGSSTFGQAFYGRQGYDTGFPALTPFSETARQVQIILKVEF